MPTRPEPILPLDWPRQSGKVNVVLKALEAKLKKRRRRRIAGAAGAAATLVLLLWVVPLLRYTGTIVTPQAQRQSLTLADGSNAELNAQTVLRTDFRYGRRTVQLDQGEAFFAVAKDPSHPFLVETPAGTIRVTGTRFNVRLEPGRTPEVTLFEGAVSFARAEPVDGPIALSPGQQMSATGAKRTLSAAELDNVLSWRTGRLALDGLTLGEAAARFAAYHGRTVRVAPAAASLRVGGSCPLDDFTGFLEFVTEALPVSVLKADDGTIRLIAR